MKLLAESQVVRFNGQLEYSRMHSYFRHAGWDEKEQKYDNQTGNITVLYTRKVVKEDI